MLDPSALSPTSHLNWKRKAGVKLLGGGVQPQNRDEDLRLEQEERQKDRAARIRSTELLREEDSAPRGKEEGQEWGRVPASLAMKMLPP